MTAAGVEQEHALDVSTDLPALAGHFPGHPIVPGVVLLDEALVAIGNARGLSLARCRLAAVKFLQPVVPPATLTIRHRAAGGAGGAGGGVIDFSILDGTQLIASGRVESVAPSGAGDR